MTDRPEITAADMSHSVEMGRINDGYFSSAENAAAFVALAVTPLLDTFESTVRYVSFGGGEGFLPSVVVSAIEASDRDVVPLVVDANADYLKHAAARGLETREASLEEVDLEGFDLVTMRSVNHYNDLATQARILERCLAALRRGGWLASQNLSGPSEAYCHMASELSRLPELGRVADGHDRPHITAETEFDDLMRAAGFAEVAVVGHAPDIVIGPAYYWARFNGRQQSEASGADLAAIMARQQAYMARANAVIEAYLADAPRADAALLARQAESYSLPLRFPVHRGRRP